LSEISEKGKIERAEGRGLRIILIVCFYGVTVTFHTHTHKKGRRLRIILIVVWFAVRACQ
jgi:hypothetical protein